MSSAEVAQAMQPPVKQREVSISHLHRHRREDKMACIVSAGRLLCWLSS